MRSVWRKTFLRIGVVLAVVALASGSGLFFYTRPHYAWLAFGPQARLRVLLCDHRLWVSMTHFVDGEPTQRIERFRNWNDCYDLTLPDPDGRTTYTITQVQEFSEAGEPKEIIATVKIDGPLAYEQYCDLSFDARDLASAKVAHFNGPLAAGAVTIAWKVPEKLALARGDNPTQLRAIVGTMDAARGGWVVVSSHDADRKPRLPSGVQPEVEIEFPSKAEDQPRFRQRFVLDQVCCGAQFYGPIRVPDEAGSGIARVTFSFPAWTEAHVASTTIELPIVDAPPAVATDGAPVATEAGS